MVGKSTKKVKVAFPYKHLSTVTCVAGVIFQNIIYSYLKM